MSDQLETTAAVAVPWRLLAPFRRGSVRKRRAAERCELCSAPLAHEHQHLIEPQTRRLVCACDPCALLFDRPPAAAIDALAPGRKC